MRIKATRTILIGKDTLRRDRVREVIDTIGRELVTRGYAVEASEKVTDEPEGKAPEVDHTAHAPKALSAMNKAELLEVVEKEGVTIAPDATNKQIVAAIEAKRG